MQTDDFSSIYEKKGWGSSETDAQHGGLNSGSGSMVEDGRCDAYIDFLNQKLSTVNSVTEVGCGDFRIGERLSLQGKSYACYDVVPKVVDHLQKTYTVGTFALGDGRTQVIEPADLLVLKDVSMHWHTADSMRSLLKLNPGFREVLITNNGDAQKRDVDVLTQHGYQCDEVLSNVCKEGNKSTHHCKLVRS